MAAGLEVAAVVFSLISAFRSGIDVVHRLCDSRRLRRRRRRVHGSRHDLRKASSTAPSLTNSLDEKQLQLTRSLGRAPEDIGREYEKDLAVLGDEFAKGDAIARASLAETLLKLNTGLVNIISSFLLAGHETRDAQLDYQSLIQLSEESRSNAVAALEGLYRRLSVGPVASPATNRELRDARPQRKPRVVVQERKLPVRSKKTMVYGIWLARKPKVKKKVPTKTEEQTGTQIPKQGDKRPIYEGRMSATKQVKQPSIQDASRDVSDHTIHERRRPSNSSTSSVATLVASNTSSVVRQSASSVTSSATSTPSNISSTIRPSASSPSTSVSSTKRSPKLTSRNPPLFLSSPMPVMPDAYGIKRRPLPQNPAVLTNQTIKSNVVSPAPCVPRPREVEPFQQSNCLRPPPPMPTYPAPRPPPQDESQHADPIRPAPPIPTAPISRARKLTPSIYSFASDSTKLGEIPEYKLVGYRAAPTSASAANQASSLALGNSRRNEAVAGLGIRSSSSSSTADYFWQPSPSQLPGSRRQHSDLSCSAESQIGDVALAESARRGKRKLWSLFKRVGNASRAVDEAGNHNTSPGFTI
ncbi:MAG: hypothetical protein M1816_003429 [Peltula sp. TS41687]|nr:MAG: hypothetical protein M1816_003429 [Peltula sp. TS41687]